jgi:hypothetical protein
MGDMNDLVSAIAGSGPAAPVRFRQGVIVSVAANYTVTVTIAGSTQQIAGVKVASHVCPIPGSSCWLITDGRDWMVMATLAPAGPAYATMRKSTGQSIPATTWTELTWGSRTDTKAVGMTLGSAGITVQVPGIYSVTATAMFVANSNGNRHTQLIKNGAVVYQGTSTTPMATNTPRLRADGLVPCVAGDVLNLQAFNSHTSAVSLDTGPGANQITATWIGPLS